MLGIFLSRNTGGNIPGASRTCSKIESVANRQLREMVVYLGGVDSLAAESRPHLLGMDALVINDGILGDVETVSIAGDSLEEGRAARTRWAEHGKHFSTVDHAFQIMENVDALLLGATNFPERRETLEVDITDAVLEGGRRAETECAKVPEGDAGRARRTALRSVRSEVVEALGPLARVEFGAVWVERTLDGQGKQGSGGSMGLGGESAGELVDLFVDALVVDGWAGTWARGPVLLSNGGHGLGGGRRLVWRGLSEWLRLYYVLSFALCVGNHGDGVN